MSSTVGRIAFIVVGTVLGAMIGQPQLGFMLGSVIGGLVFAPEGQQVEGPRIGDTDIQSSALGIIIPEHYGTTRAAGAILWSGGLKETKNKEKQGKGGGGGSVTTYEYSVSFLVSLGRGPASAVRRIWADSKIIYDATGTGEIDNGKYVFRFYKGTPDQIIDPLVEESINRRLDGLPDINEGNGPQSTYTTMDDLIAASTASAAAGEPRGQIYLDHLNARVLSAGSGGGTPLNYRFTPAYKELCVCVFEDMELKDFGNRIPNLTFEIVWDTTEQVLNNTAGVVETILPSIAPPATQQGIHHPMMALAIPQRKMLVLDDTTMRRFDYNTQTEDLFIDDARIDAIIGADAGGNFIINIDDPIELLKVARVEPTGLTIQGYVGASQGIYTAPAYAAALDDTITSSSRLMAVITTAGKLGILRTEGGGTVDAVWGEAIPDALGSVIGVQAVGPGPICPGGTSSFDGKGTGTWGRVFILGENDPTNTAWTLYSMVASYNGSGTGFTITVNVNTVLAGSHGTDTLRNVIYNATLNRVYALFDDGTDAKIIKVNPDTGTIDATYTVPLNLPDKDSGFGSSIITGTKLAWANGDDVVEMDLGDGSFTLSTDVLTNVVLDNRMIYASNRDSIYVWSGAGGDDGFQLALGRLTTGVGEGETTLANVISQILRRTGMVNSEFDVTGLSDDDIIIGFSVARPVTGRAVIDKLVLPFLVDGIETDWLVKFNSRSHTAVRTIPEQDLGAVKGPTGDVSWLESRAPDHSLPVELAIKYIDPFRDYQPNAARAKRISQPVNTMFSNRIENIELPLVMPTDFVQGAADRLLYLNWLSRDTARSKLSWEHIDLDPADVVQVDFDDGRMLTDRIVKSVIGADFTIEMNTMRAGDPISEITGNIPVNVSTIPSNTIRLPVYSKMFALDIPLLYDFHDTGRVAPRIYLAVGADSLAWSGALVYISTDGVSYVNIGTATVDITWGIATTALPKPRNLWSTDNDNSLNISLSVDNGDVVSVTRDQIINSGANRALLLNSSSGEAEIIQFQDVVIEANGTFTLTKLQRGLRGTDYHVDTHFAGEVFILLTDNAIETLAHDLSNIGSVELFKAVSSGASLVGTSAEALILVGRDLMPWAPSRVRRADDGSDLTVTWNRRTRVGGAWNMVGTGVETVPLSEDVESYEFYLIANGIPAADAFDPTDDTTYELKVVTATPTTLITAAQLSTASIALTDDINVAVYQVSTQIGRGFKQLSVLQP